MSRRTYNPVPENLDIEKNLFIQVNLYGTASRYLMNNTGGGGSYQANDIEEATVAGSGGVSLKGVDAARPYWFVERANDLEPQSIILGDRDYTFAFYANNRGARGHGWAFELIDSTGVYAGSDTLGSLSIGTSYGGNANQFKPFWGSFYHIPPPAQGVWTHVTLVYKRTTAIVYYDGIQKGETSIPILSAPYPRGIALRAGTTNSVSDSKWLFRQLRFYNNLAFSDEEVMALAGYEQGILVS